MSRRISLLDDKWCEGPYAHTKAELLTALDPPEYDDEPQVVDYYCCEEWQAPCKVRLLVHESEIWTLFGGLQLSICRAVS